MKIFNNLTFTINYGIITNNYGKCLIVWSNVMLESLFGNLTVEKILFYLQVYRQGYPKGISRLFATPVNGIQQQLRRLEEGGIVVSFLQGRTRIYQFNPRYPFLKELKVLIDKALEFLPEDEIKKYYRQRTRPRRAGKPL